MLLSPPHVLDVGELDPLGALAGVAEIELVLGEIDRIAVYDAGRIGGVNRRSQALRRSSAKVKHGSGAGVVTLTYSSTYVELHHPKRGHLRPKFLYSSISACRAAENRAPGVVSSPQPRPQTSPTDGGSICVLADVQVGGGGAAVLP